MDASWNFLKEAPESELALVREACEKSGLQISSSAFAEQVVTSILRSYELDKDNSYEEFLDKICEELSINTDGLYVENKELELLKLFLFQGIENMDENQIVIFASNYDFSNLDKEKLISEIEVRIKTSDKFKTNLYQVVPAIFGIDFTSIFPSNITELVLIDGGISVENGPVVSTLIALQNEHRKSFECDYISKYIDKTIQNNVSIIDKKKSILSVMLLVIKNMKLKIQDQNIVVEEGTSFLANEHMSLPNYILNKIPEVDINNRILYNLMEQIFPCSDNLKICYTNTSKALSEVRTKIAFFDYRFPYSRIPKHAELIYLEPNNEIEQHAVKLFLLGSGVDNPKDLLKTEDELKMSNFDYAVISHEQNLIFDSEKKFIYTEDSSIDYWKEYFNAIKRRPDSIPFVVIVEFLSEFIDNRNNALQMCLKNIVDQLPFKDHPEFEKFKLIVKRLVNQADSILREF